MGLDVELLRNSFELVVSREQQIMLRFYERLFSRYPQVRPLFSRNSRDRQAQMLTEALAAVMEHLEDAEWLEETLGALGKKHVEYGVTPEMYPWVGECLIATLAEVAGDDWSPALEEAWKSALGAVSGLMLEGAEAERATTA